KAEKNKTEPRRPLRMCCVCRTRREKSGLIRIVRTPEDSACADETGAAPGRGLYVCRSAACIGLARKRRSVERAFGAGEQSDLYAKLEELIGTG
ncbi:MAG: YlxR family protein, partial [Lachnospiraceae bacterium]|nr:YlxR family protein [Lachnospiraceae bacterium]